MQQSPQQLATKTEGGNTAQLALSPRILVAFPRSSSSTTVESQHLKSLAGNSGPHSAGRGGLSSADRVPPSQVTILLPKVACKEERTSAARK